MSQRIPVKPRGQVHLKPPPDVIEHVAPLRHGLLGQTFVVTKN
jgi:hypothetical protein